MRHLILIILMSFAVIILQGCSFTHESVFYEDNPQFSYISGEIIHLKTDSDRTFIGKLVYQSGAYFLMLQNETYDRSLRKSNTYFNGKKLTTFINHKNLVPGIPFAGGLMIKLNREEIELMASGNFKLRTMIWSGPNFVFEIPSNYAERFVAKVNEVYPFTREDYYIANVERKNH